MKIIQAWNNAPWTPRGLKFKTAVETILALVAMFVMMCEPKGWQ